MKKPWTARLGILLALGLAACNGSSPAADSAVQPDARDRGVDGRGTDGRADAGPIDPEWLKRAVDAARWIEAVAQKSGTEAYWPEYVGVPAWTGNVAYPLNLYAGNAGIALFLGKLSQVTTDATHKQTAIAAADRLVSKAISSGNGVYWKHEVELKDGTIITYDYAGLYDGAAGVALALQLLGTRLGKQTYLDTAKAAARWLTSQAKKDSSGCSWTYGFTDVIAGNAGIILFFLELHRATGDAQYLEQAKCAGDWLKAQAVSDAGGSTWPSQTSSSTYYTGLSHGVAGISYALAALSQASGDSSYLDAAKAGAKWLQAKAVCDADGCRWFHYTPGGTTTFQTGWCHGVAGTARLFLLLEKLTGDAQYRTLVDQGVRWLMKVADPAASAPDFHGLSFCCGAASVGEFFVDLFQRTGKKEHLDFAKKVGTYLAGKGKSDKGGMMWTNYDFPDSTGRIWYAPGLKLGAAGAGWLFLRLAQVGAGADWAMLPDERL